MRPEDAEWNRWNDGTLRLFNNRAALLFEIRIDGPAPLTWSPTRARLELNDRRTTLVAAPSGEILLGELLFHAYLEEQWAIEGDLVDRTRGAGPFRSAYLPASAQKGALAGLVAFPFGDNPDVHIVAMRLSLDVTAGGTDRDLVWVFD